MYSKIWLFHSSNFKVTKLIHWLFQSTSISPRGADSHPNIQIFQSSSFVDSLSYLPVERARVFLNCMNKLYGSLCKRLSPTLCLTWDCRLSRQTSTRCLGLVLESWAALSIWATGIKSHQCFHSISDSDSESNNRGIPQRIDFSIDFYDAIRFLVWCQAVSNWLSVNAFRKNRLT